MINRGNPVKIKFMMEKTFSKNICGMVYDVLYF